MGEVARRSLGLALGDLVPSRGEVEEVMGDGMRTGEEDFMGLITLTGDVVGEIENESIYLSGILTGVDGRRGLCSPLFGLSGCGSECRGLPSGLHIGLGLGVAGVKVSELASDLNKFPVESVGLSESPVALAG